MAEEVSGEREAIEALRKKHKLNDRQHRFAEIFLLTQDSKKALIQAGFVGKNVDVTASRYKNHPGIRAYLEERAQALVSVNINAITALVKSLDKRDAYALEVYRCFDAINDPKHATKYKYLELLGKVLGHLDTQTRQTFNFNVDNRTLNHTEIVQGASEIAAKLANLAVFNPRIARNPVTIQHIDVPRETLSDADDDV